ncbi:MAG: hypothetical protein LC132_04355 [Burkholderiales bacterium]|nr:hypothetical protein [Burkholderiales bacterium]
MHLESNDTRKKQVVQFADEIFKAYCVTNFDIDRDGEISLQEALKIRVVYCDNMSIRSLQGIEHFTNLTDLSCSDNKISTLDLSQGHWKRSIVT